MSPSARKLLWLVIGAGLIARLVVAFTTYGVVFDVDAYGLVRTSLGHDLLHVYSDTNRWPYPPGYFLWIAASAGIEGLSGLHFSDLVQVPPILADGALAWLVQDYLGHRGATERTRLAAAALVALGPAFAIVSGYHGQIDSLAVLPGVAGLVLWERKPQWRRRALASGLLIAAGALVKTVPLVLLFALLPSARSRREAVSLVGAAVVPVVLALAPFALADPGGVETALRYHGVPGVGGISLLVQPDLARVWMNEVPVAATGVTNALFHFGGAITGAVVLAVGAFLFRYRPRAVEGAALLNLALWAFGINFFLQYVIWGFPFLIMAGYLRQVAAAQALMLPATVLAYLRPWESAAVAPAYVVASLALWVAWVVGFVLLARRIAQTYPPRPWSLRSSRPGPGAVGTGLRASSRATNSGR
jgi:hypothetical protein